MVQWVGETCWLGYSEEWEAAEERMDAWKLYGTNLRMEHGSEKLKYSESSPSHYTTADSDSLCGIRWESKKGLLWVRKQGEIFYLNLLSHVFEVIVNCSGISLIHISVSW